MQAGSADLLESEMEPGDLIAKNARIKKALKKKIKMKNDLAEAYVAAGMDERKLPRQKRWSPIT